MGDLPRHRANGASVDGHEVHCRHMVISSGRCTACDSFLSVCRARWARRMTNTLRFLYAHKRAPTKGRQSWWGTIRQRKSRVYWMRLCRSTKHRRRGGGPRGPRGRGGVRQSVTGARPRAERKTKTCGRATGGMILMKGFLWVDAVVMIMGGIFCDTLAFFSAT